MFSYLADFYTKLYYLMMLFIEHREFVLSKNESVRMVTLVFLITICLCKSILLDCYGIRLVCFSKRKTIYKMGSIKSGERFIFPPSNHRINIVRITDIWSKFHNAKTLFSLQCEKVTATNSNTFF